MTLSQIAENDRRSLREGYGAGIDTGWEVLIGADTAALEHWLPEIVEAIGSSTNDGGSWFALMEALLLMLRQHVHLWPYEEIDAWDDDCDVAVGFDDLVTESSSGRVGTERSGRIAQYIIAQQSTPVSSGRALWLARRLAISIDENIFDSYVDWARQAVTMTIEPGRAYPVASINPTIWMDGSANTRPEHRDSLLPERGIYHVRIGEEHHDSYRITLDWSLSGQLATILDQHSLRMMTFHANQSSDEFGIAFDPVKLTAINNGPKDRSKQISALSAMFELAAEHGANVIVVPEYCLNVDSRHEFIQSASVLPFAIISGGSGRSADYNEGALFISRNGRSHELNFLKLHRARFFGYDEEIHRTHEVTVWRSDPLALAVLICRDAQDDKLIDILADVGVNLCLVPSFSDRAANITGMVETLSIRSQAFVVVAVSPREFHIPPEIAAGRPTEGRPRRERAAPADAEKDQEPEDLIFTRDLDAFFSGPYGDDSGPPQIYAPGTPVHCSPAGATPGVWLFDSRGRIATWFPV